MKRLHILIVYLVLLTFTVGAAVFLVSTGEIELERTKIDHAPEENSDAVGNAGDVPDAGVTADAESEGLDQESPSFIGPRLYLVLDDAGHSLDQVRLFVRFPGAFTLAVLPELRYSAQSARMAVAAGHSVILHQPMEPLGDQDPGPGAIRVGDEEEKIRRTLARNIASVPGVVGVNNHMGSKVTSDVRTMEIVVRELADQKLFFLDSRTTADTVAVEVGRVAGVTVQSRDVFLDNVPEADAINAQIDEALDIAKRKGWAVMIGHVTVPQLAEVLTGRYEEIIAAGFRFFPIEDLYSRLDDAAPRD